MQAKNERRIVVRCSMITQARNPLGCRFRRRKGSSRAYVSRVCVACRVLRYPALGWRCLSARLRPRYPVRSSLPSCSGTSHGVGSACSRSPFGARLPCRCSAFAPLGSAAPRSVSVGVVSLPAHVAMAIICVDGGLGSGKSLTAVGLAYDEYLKGRPVYANFSLAFGIRVSSWADVVAIRDGVFVWDEAHLDIDSRTFMSHATVTPWLTQLRKLGVDLIYISQNIDQVDVRLRRLTDMLLRCEKVVSESGQRGTRITVVDMFALRVVSESQYLHNPALYALYDTRELILPLSGKIPTLGALV